MVALVIVVLSTAHEDPNASNILPLTIAAGAPIFLGGLIWAYLLIATSLRQARAQRQGGWPPSSPS
jgi:hypothetical protein